MSMLVSTCVCGSVCEHSVDCMCVYVVQSLNIGCICVCVCVGASSDKGVELRRGTLAVKEIVLFRLWHVTLGRVRQAECRLFTSLPLAGMILTR